jgi:hypothetical protein
MAEPIASPHINLSGSSAELDAALARAKKSLRSFDVAGAAAGKAVGQSFAALGTRLAAAVATFAVITSAIESFSKAIDDTAALGRLSQQTGIAVETLSELRFAVEQAGLPFESFEQAVRGFTQRLQEGLGNATSSVALALNGLGVSARDANGQLRNFDEILPDLADAFSRYSDGINKAQIASALFGEEAGPKLINLLNRGRAGIEELSAQARKLGVVLTDDGVRKAKDYQAAVAQLNSSISALVTEFALRLAPAVTMTADTITRLMQLLPRISAGVDTRGTQVEIDRLTQGIQEQERAVAALTVQIDRQTEARGRADARLVRSRDAGALHLQQLRDELEAERALMAMRQSGYAGPPAPVAPPAPDLSARRAQLEQARFELEQFMQMATGTKTWLESMNTAWMSHADVVAEAQRRIQQAYKDTAEGRRQLAATEHQISLQYEDQLKHVALTAASTLTTVFKENKTAAIAAAIINTSVAITEALKLMFPLNWAQVALVSAAGLAQISAIRSTTKSGGGSVPSVSGGSGAAVSAPPATAAPLDPGQSLLISIEPGRYSDKEVDALIAAINNRVTDGNVKLIATKRRNDVG